MTNKVLYKSITCIENVHKKVVTFEKQVKSGYYIDTRDRE